MRIAFQDNILVQYIKNIESDFKEGVFVGFTAFYRGNNRRVSINSAYFCLIRTITPRIFFSENKNNILAGTTFFFRIVLYSAYNDQITNFGSYSDFTRNGVTTSCSNVRIPSLADESGQSVISSISGCNIVGEYTLFGILRFGNYTVLINETFRINARTWDLIRDFNDFSRSCSRTQVRNSLTFLNCGENNGNYSEDQGNALQFSFITIDSFNNQFFSNVTGVQQFLSLFNSNHIRQSFSVQTNNSVVYINVPKLAPGTYYFSSQKFNTSLVINYRLFFVIDPSDPDERFSKCSFKNYPALTQIILKNEDEIIYECLLFDLNKNSIKDEIVTKLIASNDLTCQFSRTGGELISSERYSEPGGKFLCKAKFSKIGLYSVKASFYNKLKEEKIFPTDINSFIVKGYPFNFNEFLYYDFIEQKFLPLTSNLKFTYNSSANFITCLVSRILGESMSTSSYDEKFLQSFSSSVSYSEVFEGLDYGKSQTFFELINFSGQDCISIKLKDNNFIRKSSFDYIIDVSFSRDTTSKITINLNQLLSTGGKETSAFDIDYSKTKVNSLLESDKIYLGQELSMFTFESRTKSNRYFNYRPNIESIVNSSTILCGVNKEKMDFKTFFEINPLGLDGMYLMKNKYQSKENICDVKIQEQETLIHSFSIKFEILKDDDIDLGHEVDMSKTEVKCKSSLDFQTCTDIFEITNDSPINLHFYFKDENTSKVNRNLSEYISVKSISMSGNNMTNLDSFKTSFVNRGSQLILEMTDNAKEEHKFLVSGDYTLNFTIYYSKLTTEFKKTFTLRLKTNFNDSEYGNGDYDVSNTTFSIENFKYVNQVTLSNSFEFSVRTSKGKLYNRWLDVNNFKLSDDKLIETTFEKTQIKGTYLVTFIGKPESGKVKEVLFNLLINHKDRFQKVNKDFSLESLPLYPPLLSVNDLSYEKLVILPTELISFKIILKDKFGNIFTTKSLSLSSMMVKVNNEYSPRFITIDFENGFYTFSFKPDYPPIEQRIAIIFNDGSTYIRLLEEKNEPLFKIKSIIDTSRYVISGKNLNQMMAGESLDIMVQAFDSNGICYELESNEDPIDIVIEELDSKTPKTYIYDLKIVESTIEGTCKRIYVLDNTKASEYTKVGNYKITVRRLRNIRINKEDIIQRVIHNSINQNNFVSKWEMSGSFNPSRINAGESIVFSILGRDDYLNPVLRSLVGRIKVKLMIESSDQEINPDDFLLQEEEKQIGKLTLTLKIYKSNSYYINYYYKDVKIKVNTDVGPNIINIVPTKCDKDNSEVIYKNLENQMIIGEQYTFKINCFDFYKNKVPNGGAQFVINSVIKNSDNVIIDTDVKTNIIDELNGNYSIQFSPYRVGNYFFNIQLEKLEVKSFNLAVINSFCEKDKLLECPNNSKLCVKDLYECLSDQDKKNCSKDSPFYCQGDDGKFACMKSQSDCKCKDGYQRCKDSNSKICVPNNSLFLCPFSLKMTCSRLKLNVQCPDGICKNNLNECSNRRVCPLGNVLCPDLSCRKNLEDCIIYKACASNQITCPDQTCVSDQKDCPSLLTCQKRNQVVCPSGECVDSEILCPKLPKCLISPNTILCPNNTCVSNVMNCPKTISCGHGKSLCRDMICRDKCSIE